MSIANDEEWHEMTHIGSRHADVQPESYLPGIGYIIVCDECGALMAGRREVSTRYETPVKRHLCKHCELREER